MPLSRLAAVAVVVLVLASSVPAHASAPVAAGAGTAPPAVDVALQGATATATSAASGRPARAAIDGDAASSWCAIGWTGQLTVDLGTVRGLSGVGVTLAASASPSTASVEIASRPGVWRTVPSAANVALDPNTPSYFAADTTARWARLTVSTGDGSAACVGEFRVFARTAASRQMMHGADLSFMQQELAAGTRFTDQGQAGTPLQILRDHGLDYVRMRLWVDPPAGYSNLAADLALARKVRAAGLGIYLDIHYADFWADPQGQPIPAAWRGEHLAALAQTVRSYTSDVIAAFAHQQTPVSMVSIGNEIRNGMLWPIGKIDWTANTGWDHLATLLKAGVAGAHDANPAGNRLRVMLHFDHGGDNVDSRTFFGNLADRGVRFDVIGLSYYPFWHGTLRDLRANVDDLAGQFDKDIVVAETQYAWTLANGDSTGNFVWQRSQLSRGYPASPGGQLSLENDVQSILAAVPDGHGLGVFYWEPEWVPGVGWEPGAGTPNDNLTLFDFQGRALPSVGVYEDPVAACERYAPGAGPCVLPS